MEKEQLAAAVMAMIEAGPEGSGEAFAPLALEMFRFQYHANAPYRAFCDCQGVTPATVDHYRQIPAFPTDAFKRELVTSFPLQEAVMAQLTSGTTANRRGQIFRDHLGKQLILAANQAMTRAYLFPEMEQPGGEEKRWRVLILAPSPQMAPSMGMAIGMERTRAVFGTPDSRFLLGKSGIDIKGLLAALEASEAGGQPVALIGATGAFVWFLKACRARKVSFRLPPGSRLSDGGGYRGRFGAMDREGFLAQVGETLGVEADHCVNVLGMAESATNYFENVLRERVRTGITASRRMITPPWARVEVVDLQELKPLPAGEVGLLRHYDLVNLPTVMAVQSDNLGVMEADGSFRILGRAKVEGNKVSALPGERTVGPLGDNRLFRFLESYVNFSIRFKMGWVTGRRPLLHGEGLGMAGDCPCGESVEKMVEGSDQS